MQVIFWTYVKILHEEANQQMSVISQASSALNLCRATKEFFGSAEQVNQGSNYILKYSLLCIG